MFRPQPGLPSDPAAAIQSLRGQLARPGFTGGAQDMMLRRPSPPGSTQPGYGAPPARSGRPMPKPAQMPIRPGSGGSQVSDQVDRRPMPPGSLDAMNNAAANNPLAALHGVGAPPSPTGLVPPRPVVNAAVGAPMAFRPNEIPQAPPRPVVAQPQAMIPTEVFQAPPAASNTGFSAGGGGLRPMIPDESGGVGPLLPNGQPMGGQNPAYQGQVRAALGRMFQQ